MNKKKSIISIILMMMLIFSTQFSFAISDGMENVKAKQSIGAGVSSGKIVVAKAIASGKRKIVVQWQKTQGATKYDVYAVAGAKTPKITIKNRVLKSKNTTRVVASKVSRKAIKTKTIYTFVVRALNSKNAVLAKSKNLVVIAGTTNKKKQSNAKKITVSKTSDTVLIGNTYKFGTSQNSNNIVKISRKTKTKKPKGGTEPTYLSADTSIAKIDNSGNLKSLKEGIVDVYVQTHNGLWAKAIITVESTPLNYEFKFIAEADSTKIGFEKHGKAPADLYYTKITADGTKSMEIKWDASEQITLNKDEAISVKNKNHYLSTSDYDYINFTIPTGTARIEGDYRALGKMGDYAFYRAFSHCENLTAASDLPNIALSDCCCDSMFFHCDNLKEAPQLPSTELALGCYGDMFGYCLSLREMPMLPATTLADYCYLNMFEGCENLNKANKLPAPMLKVSCYSGMFNGCSNLSQAPELPATTLADGCYESMFQFCESLNEAPQLPAQVLTDECYMSMFTACTNLVNTPELPAITLANRCYERMFERCVKLTKIPDLPATKLTDFCYFYMFDECTGIKLSTTKTGEYVKEYSLPAIETIGNCSLDEMFYDTGGTFKGTPNVNTVYYVAE